MMLALIHQAERFLQPTKRMTMRPRVENAICAPMPRIIGMKQAEGLMGNKPVSQYVPWAPSCLPRRSPSRKETMGTK